METQNNIKGNKIRLVEKQVLASSLLIRCILFVTCVSRKAQSQLKSLVQFKPPESLPIAAKEAAARHGRRRTTSVISGGEHNSNKIPIVRHGLSRWQRVTILATKLSLLLLQL
ncbi:hypothetical protein E2542_SST08654 [Spatholobus suberectus]|nr:hypothetical protein E2542_SST08654 [Spatholobus suberectus]